MNFMEYQNSNGLPADNSPPSQVTISSPNDGAQLAADDTQTVKAIAMGAEKFLAMELWINGELVSVQAAPSGGSQPFSTAFFWQPKQAGSYSLIVAAIKKSGEKNYSPQTVVFVTLDENQANLEVLNLTDSSVVLPASGVSGDTSPSAPATNQTMGSAEHWSGAPANWINSLTTADKPAAPELIAEPASCGVNLLIHDLSLNEEGFAIFRNSPTDSTWQFITSLSSQSKNEWITFEDAGVTGPLTYYVAAFNSKGESKSNLAMANIDPTNCPGDPDLIQGVTLEVTNLKPSQPAEMNYCYVSLDGKNWTRWPQFGFHATNEQGYIAGGPVIHLQTYGLDGQPSTQYSDVFMECWGWQNGALVQLGDLFVQDLTPEYFDPHIISNPELQAEVTFEPFDFVSKDDLFPIGPGSTAGSPFTQDNNLMPEFTSSLWIPRPLLWVSYTPEMCAKHVPAEIDTPAEMEGWCYPIPPYTFGTESQNPQPILLWYPDGTFPNPDCIGGLEGCHSYETLKSFDGKVGFDVAVAGDTISATWQAWNEATMFLVPPQHCTGKIYYSVRLWFQPENPTFFETDEMESGVVEDPLSEVIYGPWSNWVQIPCFGYTEELVEFDIIQFVDVTFSFLHTNDVDDGGNINSIEIYGYFKVNAPSMGYEIIDPNNPQPLENYWYLNLATWNEQGANCPDETLHGDDYFTSPGSGCPPKIWDGTYILSDFEICQSTSKKDCDTEFQQNNNTLRIKVEDGDALGLEVAIYDWDDASANDLVCEGIIMTQAKSQTEWANTKNEAFTIPTNKTDSGQCQVQGVINAAGP